MNYSEQIHQILGPAGLLSKSMPDMYEHREQQVHMALEVYKALVSDDRLIIEAPTGTGKTLAYLIAAALSRKRVAISTGTKNLQEQLFLKDIPFVQKFIFPQLKASLLKGRGNYVCHARLRRFLRQPYLDGIPEFASINQILAWYRDTRETGNGDRAELTNLPDDDPVWPEICSTSETCLGKRCSDKDECFVAKMRSKAMDTDLMVINHHLLMSDMAVRESGFGEVIPRYEALVVDEAHGMEDAATQHFGFHMSQFRLTRMLRDVRSDLTEASLNLEKFENSMRTVDEAGRRLFASFSDAPLGRAKIGAIHPELAEIRELLCNNLEALGSMISNLPKVSEELQTAAQRIFEISMDVGIILASEQTGDYACWTERRDRSLMIHASPVEVSVLMQTKLYEKISSIVFTSATLSAGGSLEYFKSRLGLNEDPVPTEIVLDSPFDHSSQTMMYVPQSIPEPNSANFLQASEPVVRNVLLRTKGRAFVLFTSYRNMETLYSRMSGTLPFPLLMQGQKPKTRLLEEFRNRAGSVLFATSSFWEGVDVQGEALSCVIIDRLPFAPPDDPIISARIERLKRKGLEPFYSLQVPMAVLALKQGFGRLIRTRTDRGILCLLDVRIINKSYGRVFRRSLQHFTISRELTHIEDFFSPQGNEIAEKY
jgi:ATP-dependent DNA helicase DinG